MNSRPDFIVLNFVILPCNVDSVLIGIRQITVRNISLIKEKIERFFRSAVKSEDTNSWTLKRNISAMENSTLS